MQSAVGEQRREPFVLKLKVVGLHHGTKGYKLSHVGTVNIVVNIDQRSSRASSADPIPEWELALNGALADRAVLPFERTAGDEIQGVISEPEDLVQIIRRAARLNQWYVGIGAGATDLGASSRASRGEAFGRAREAVEEAKRRVVPVVFRAGAGTAGQHADTALVEERSTRRAVAEVLGVTHQAVGQVAQRYNLELEPRVAALAAEMVRRAVSL
jgi:hypothetical protein